MNIHFWGTRGSLPASITAKQVRKKIFRALQASQEQGLYLSNDKLIETFIDTKLPFAVRGSYGGNTACVEIAAAGSEYVLCDAGTGLRDFGHAFLRAGRGTSPAVFHLFLSHLHWDHLQGFPFFVPAYRPGNQIHIYGGHADLEAAFVRQQDAPSFPVPFSALGAEIHFHTLETDRAYRIAGLDVRAIRQNHPGDSYGYSFVGEGKKCVYSTDMEHGLEAQEERYPFIDFFRDADLLIFDAQYSLAEAIGMKETWGHSSNLIAVELAVRTGVRRLCLFHSEPTWDDEALDHFLNETRAYLQIYDPASPLQIDLAWDGLEIAC
ncbi:MAG: MBL fold metallo-hydrolase [Deltaproteobacteria bacterium]|nr:MBL fold metallo-hydrolase [Deltaproteobacteria bacterium]